MDGVKDFSLALDDGHRYPGGGLIEVNSAGKEGLRNQLYERDGQKCHYCGIEEARVLKVWGMIYKQMKRGRRLELDHKDNGGDDGLNNLVLACAICNIAKSNKFTYEEFKKVGEVIKVIWQDRQGV